MKPALLDQKSGQRSLYNVLFKFREEFYHPGERPTALDSAFSVLKLMQAVYSARLGCNGTA
jgi:hypothetical protein